MSLHLPTRRALWMGSDPNLTRNLVASYRLGEASGTRYDSVSPGIGPAAQFVTDNSEYLSRADNADLSTGDIDFSVAAWVRFDTITGTPIVVSKWDDETTDNREYAIQLIASRFNLVVNSTGAAAQSVFLAANTFGDVSADTWYFVVVYHDSVNNRIGISVNDVADTAAHTAGVYDSIAPFMIGAFRPVATTNFLNGRVQCVGFWKKVLSAAEITSLYNAGRGLAYRDLSGSLLTSLTEWWDLSEPAGTRVGSVGANNLTDNNTVTQAVGVAGGNSLGAAAAPGNAAGKIGNAVQLTAASSQYLATPDNTDLSMGDIDFMVAAWVYLDSKTADMAFVGKYGIAANSEWLLNYDQAADRFRFHVSNDGTAVTSLSAATLGSPSLSTSYHVIAWHDATANTINIQVNNGGVDSAAYTTGVYNGTSPFAIGRVADGSQYMDGRIDAVHVWKNRILTAAERTALYNGTRGREYPMAA